MNLLPGVQRITADSVVGVSGARIRVYSINLTSTGTASTLIMKDGTSSSGTALVQVDGVISQCVTKNFTGGLIFNSGCFADCDANISYATIVYTQETL